MYEDNIKQIFGLIFTVSNRLQVSIDRTLKDDSLTAKQFLIMIIINSFDSSPSLSQISERFGSSRQNSKQILNKLVKNDYVVQKQDKKDKRTLRFSLSPKALDYWKDRNFKDDIRMLDLFANMDDEMIKFFLKALKQLIINMKLMEEEDANNSRL